MHVTALPFFMTSIYEALEHRLVVSSGTTKWLLLGFWVIYKDSFFIYIFKGAQKFT